MQEWLTNTFLPWFKAASIRAVKTIAQTAIALIGTTAVTLGEVDWATVVSAAVLAGILSLLTSIAGLPELSESESEETVEMHDADESEESGDETEDETTALNEDGTEAQDEDENENEEAEG